MQVILQADEDLCERPSCFALEFRCVVIRQCTEGEIRPNEPGREDRGTENHGTEEERTPEMPRPLPECIERENQEEWHTVIARETRESKEDADCEVPSRLFLSIQIGMQRKQKKKSEQQIRAPEHRHDDESVMERDREHGQHGDLPRESPLEQKICCDQH